MSEPHAAAVLQRAAPPKTRRSEVYRHELKYRISYAEKAALELRLAPLLFQRPGELRSNLIGLGGRKPQALAIETEGGIQVRNAQSDVGDL